MLDDLDRKGTRWTARCDRCLTPFSIVDGTLDEARAALVAADWELREGLMVWCLACSRTAREVKAGPGQRRRR